MKRQLSWKEIKFRFFADLPHLSLDFKQVVTVLFVLAGNSRDKFFYATFNPTKNKGVVIGGDKK